MLGNKKGQVLDIGAIPSGLLRLMLLIVVGIIFYAMMPVIGGFVSNSMSSNPGFLTRLALLSIVPGGWFLYFIGGVLFIRYGRETSA